MRIAIVGSRTWSDKQPIYDYISRLPKETVLVSGGAKGVDTFAQEAADRYGLILLEFKPDYKQHGKRAPFIRNQQIVDASHFVVAFWDKQSRGTLDTLKRAKNAELPILVIYPSSNAMRWWPVNKTPDPKMVQLMDVQNGSAHKTP